MLLFLSLEGLDGMTNIRSLISIGLASSGLAVTPAHATWSILMADPATGEVAIGSATCLTGFDLRAESPVLMVGQGAAAAQSLVDTSGRNRALIQDLLISGASPATILNELSQIDGQHERRQYGFVDTRGRRETFSGQFASEWKGGVTGSIDGIVYSIQGNILTGEPVVAAAEDALVDAITSGADIADALMVSMEAARLLGGDGRCSCDLGPTDCGSPVIPFDPDFTKTADVGYMLVARPGDIDVSIRRWQLDDRSRGIAFADFNGDGKDDVAVAQLQRRNVFVFENNTRVDGVPSRGLPDLTERAVLAGNARYQAAHAADFNDDGTQDILAIGNREDAELFLGRGNFAFDAPLGFAVIDDASDAEIFDFVPGVPGPELFVVGRRSQQVALYSTTGGVITLIGEVHDVPGEARNAAVGPATDPLVGLALETTNTLFILSPGEGGITEIATIATGEDPRGVAAGDFNADGLADFAVVGRNSGIVEVFTRDAASTTPAFTRQEVLIGIGALDLLAADIDNDGDQDLLVARGQVDQDLFIISNNGDGTFTPAGARAASEGGNRLFARDLSGDGLPEIIGASNNGVTVAENRGTGPAVEAGPAGGDYHLALNVAFALFSDPDPVLTLRDQYDLWRTSLAGVPDAVRSALGPRPAVIQATSPSGAPENTFTLEIEARDLNFDPAILNLAEITAAVDPGQPQLVRLESALPTPDGVQLILSTTGQVGRVPLNITLANIQSPSGTREVYLLPRPTIRLGVTVADLTTDGLLDLSDVDTFLSAYNAQSPLADLDGNGTVDDNDVDTFIGAFTG
ncbi:MAG: FG-GAP-like repeat-containing protein [Planctomycetota bacterium]